jgi:hypothetical protein
MGLTGILVVVLGGIALAAVACWLAFGNASSWARRHPPGRSDTRAMGRGRPRGTGRGNRLP